MRCSGCGSCFGASVGPARQLLPSLRSPSGGHSNQLPFHLVEDQARLSGRIQQPSARPGWILAWTGTLGLDPADAVRSPQKAKQLTHRGKNPQPGVE